MKKSMEYARDAFKAVDNEKIYLFPGSCFSGEKGWNIEKLMSYNNTERVR